jgi:phospholipase A1
MRSHEALGCVLAACCITGGLPCVAFAGPEISQCRAIPDSAARLKCYDTLPNEDAAAAPPLSPIQKPPEAAAPLLPAAKPGGEKVSNLGRIWELDPGTKTEVFSLHAYRQNYLLAFTHTTSPNTAPYQSTINALASGGLLTNDTGLTVDKNEAAFQLSLKTKAVENVFSDRADLWLGYTQRSFWQAYNHSASAPFRDTNYEPEAMLVVRTDYDVFGMNWRFANFGLVHQSNGRGDPLSRSWNRAYVQFGLEKDNFALQVRPWYRFKEDADKDNNPDILKYMGHGDVVATYKLNNHVFSAMGRYNPGSGYGAGQLDWSFPLYKSLKGYVQLFSGYGYNLLDYNHGQTVFGIGFLLTDWM